MSHDANETNILLKQPFLIVRVTHYRSHQVGHIETILVGPDPSIVSEDAMSFFSIIADHLYRYSQVTYISHPLTSAWI